MKNKTILFISIAIIMTSVVTAIAYFRSRTYDTVLPRIGAITEAVYGLGKVKSNHRFEIIIGVVATVEKLYTDEGMSVTRGASLIKFEDGSVFRAPFDGVVTLVKVRAGETALPHVPLLRLEDLQSRYIELSLEQQAALRIKKGQKAHVSFESLRGQLLDGEVTALFPRQDEFVALVSVNALEPQVLPGMTADVTVEVGTIPKATLVPLKALRGGMLTVKRGGLWKKIKVEVGHIDGSYAEIKGDALNADDKIRVKRGE